MPDDLPFDPTQIISDDPNVVPDQNARDFTYTPDPNAPTVVSSDNPPSDIQDTGDQVIDQPRANLQSDQGMVHSGNTDWGFWSQSQVNYGKQYGSVADGVVNALQAGHTWNEIQDYVNAVQPLNGGPDQLVDRFKRPNLNRLMDPAPITAEEFGVGF